MNSIQINERFAHVSASTLEAIHSYHQTHDVALVQPIFEGLLAECLPEVGQTTSAIDPSTALSFNALGLESLTLLEMVLDLQEALEIRLKDDDLRGCHSIQETHALLVQKVSGLGPNSLRGTNCPVLSESAGGTSRQDPE